MSKFNKKLISDFTAHRAQVGAIIVVVALGVIMFSGPLLAQRDLNDSIDAIYGHTRYEDFSVDVESAPADSAKAVSGLNNIKASEGRLARDLLGEVKGRPLTLRILSVPDAGRPSVNDLIVESGSYLNPSASGECLAEHHLATEFKLKPGDLVRVNVGGVSVPLRVTGTVVSPEYLRLARSRAEYATDPAQFGVVFVRYSEVEELLGIQDVINNIVARVRDQRLLQETMEEVRALLEPYNVTSLMEAGGEPGTVTLNLEINDIGKLALFFAVLLLGVASLALYITMTRIVLSQQREIGVTRALGYGKRVIVSHYLAYGALLGAIGGALGVGVGYLLSRIYISVYADIFELPLVTTSLNLWIAVAGVSVGIVFAVAGAFVPARHAVRMRPAEAMRIEAGLSLGPARHDHKPGIIGRLRLPAWLRISFRNLTRNRRRTALTCLGVVGALCLLVTATGGRDSLDYAVEKHLRGVTRWDVAAIWQKGAAPSGTLDRVRAIEDVTAAEPAIEAPAVVAHDANSVDVQVLAYGGATVMHGDYPTSGAPVRPGPGEVVLNRGIRTKLPVGVGETVTLSTPVGSLPFKVAGFVSEPFGGVCYVNLAYIQSLISAATGTADPYNVIVVKAVPGTAAEVANAFRGLPGVSQVLTKTGILKIFEELVDAVDTVFVIFYVMAFAMGFAILFSMTTVNLLERGREIATIRTLGVGRARIFSFVTVENGAVVLAALIPGLILGRLLEWTVIEKLLGSDRLAPDAVITGGTVFVVIVATLAVMVLSELPSIVRLWHLDLARATKERAD